MEFKDQLTRLREKKGLSNRQLAELASVPHSLIAGLQSGRRSVGEFQARKIGRALGLQGEALETFVLAAISTCTEKVLNELRDYPASILNFLAKQLFISGILPQHLNQFQAMETGERNTIKLYLANGQVAELSSTLRYA